MSPTTSIRLLQFTDTHLQSTVDSSLRGVKTLPALQETMAHAHHHFPSVDALLLTGDLVQDDAAGYDLIRAAFAASPVPVLCLPGNHDLPDAMRSALAGDPFQIGGCRVLGDWIIVLLDTWLAASAAGHLGAEQLQRLDDTLAAHQERHALICLHHHPIPMQSRWLDTVGLIDAPQFLSVIDKHANVKGVLWGHVHQALDRLVEGVRYMATPATCTQFLPRSEHFVIDKKPPGYRVLELLPNGNIATEVLWVETSGQRRIVHSR